MKLQLAPMPEDNAPVPASPNAAAVYHRPVLRAEVLELLRPAPGRTFIDGTLGGGGHSEALLEAGAKVIAIDQDPEAIAFAGHRLARFGDLLTLVRGNFAEVEGELDRLGAAQVDGVLLDIGISSHQVDSAERGFSFAKDGPLDMRMNPAGPVRASDLVNTMSATQLERIFRVYGEESHARRISLRLVRDRAVAPFLTTLQLADSIQSVVPRRGKTHPATRVFQALRIAVNRELEALEQALPAFAARLAPGGRFAVITFHSLEDRIVKQYFQTRSAEQVDDPTWPAARPNPDRLFQKVTGKALIAGETEQQSNPRARSAKLRVVERCH